MGYQTVNCIEISNGAILYLFDTRVTMIKAPRNANMINITCYYKTKLFCRIFGAIL